MSRSKYMCHPPNAGELAGDINITHRHQLAAGRWTLAFSDDRLLCCQVICHRVLWHDKKQILVNLSSEITRLSNIRPPLGSQRHSEMTATDGTTPQVSRWQVVVRSYLVQPLLSRSTRRTFPAAIMQFPMFDVHVSSNMLATCSKNV